MRANWYDLFITVICPSKYNDFNGFGCISLILSFYSPGMSVQSLLLGCTSLAIGAIVIVVDSH